MKMQVGEQECKRLTKKNIHHHVSINDNSMYVNQWCTIAQIAMTMWQNKVKSDVQSIQDRFTIPIAI